MRSEDLLATAEYLLERPGGSSSADKCRSISTLYYSVFHFLAKACADLLVGDDPALRSEKAWRHLYRSLAHSTVFKKCHGSRISRFPVEIQDLASLFCTLQIKREKSDYSYREDPKLSAIQADIGDARKLMARFRAVDVKDRTAFAVFILIEKHRYEEADIEL